MRLIISRPSTTVGVYRLPRGEVSISFPFEISFVDIFHDDGKEWKQEAYSVSHPSFAMYTQHKRLI